MTSNPTHQRQKRPWETTSATRDRQPNDSKPGAPWVPLVVIGGPVVLLIVYELWLR